MDAATRKIVERATVRIGERTKHAQGVLVAGPLVLTAAHCVTWDARGRMALGELVIEMVRKGRNRFRMEVLAAEPVADIAILGPVDDQQPELIDDYDAFQAWADRTTPLRVAPWDPPPWRPALGPGGEVIRPAAEQLVVRLAVHLRTVKSIWIDGHVVQRLGGRVRWPMVGLEMAGAIPSGTSGGPIVDDEGQLVGVVSSSAKCPILSRALPRWAWSHIVTIQGDVEPQ